MTVQPDRIMALANAFYGSCVLFSASDLGVFQHLASAGRSDAAGVAQSLNLDERGTRLLLDGCVALGLLEKEDARYSNSPEAAAYLVAGMPGDLSRAIRYNRDVYGAWGKLPELVRLGRPVEAPETHLGDDPARTRAFVHSMHGRALGIGRMVIPMLALPERGRLLDIGGGSGAYAMLAAEARPGLRCTVLDLPGVVAIATELVAEAGLAERVSCMAGDYHTADFPPDNDVINILGVLHQEAPEAIIDIFRRCHAALKPGGVINVLDMMTDETRCAPAFSALFAVNMALTTTNGWVFSDRDVESWLAEAGFVDVGCCPVPPPMPHWLATARKQ
ncbi:MAG: methyltransferase domain-containing protein [Lentisphaerae bacterium]|nr:methyltransferase domain-containing protein [Lentisphaerota bacterium]